MKKKYTFPLLVIFLAFTLYYFWPKTIADEIPPGTTNSANSVADELAINPVIYIEPESLIFYEGQQFGEIVVKLSKSTRFRVTADIAFVDQSAFQWADYISFDRTIVFSPGEVLQLIEFNLLDDTIAELSENFEILIAQPNNALLSAGGRFQATIIDNDQKNSGTVFFAGNYDFSTRFSTDNLSEEIVGYNVSMNGDINIDGFSDIAIGNYLFDGVFLDEGAVHILYGSPTIPENEDISITYNSITITGSEEGLWFGHSVSIGDDVDGDGYSDLAIGARFHSGINGAKNAGAVFLISGKDLPIDAGSYSISDIPHTKIGWNIPNGELGFEVSVGGDFDGDLLADILIRGIQDPVNQVASVFLIPGSTVVKNNGKAIDLTNDKTILRFFSEYLFSDQGRTLTFLDDFDGDGNSELAWGSLDGTISLFPNQLQPRRPFLWVVSSQQINGSGQKNISLDIGEGIKRFTIESDQRFHISVGSAGDIDSDGLGDLLVGLTNIHNHLQENGTAILVLGKTLSEINGEVPLATATNLIIKTSEVSRSLDGDLFGWSVSEKAGDVDKDGIVDLLVGSRGASFFGPETGAVFLIPSSIVNRYLVENKGVLLISETEEVISIVGENPGDLFSSKRRISNAGDINGDGYSDILVGAPGYLVDGVQHGAAYLISGFDLINLRESN